MKKEKKILTPLILTLVLVLTISVSVIFLAKFVAGNIGDIKIYTKFKTEYEIGEQIDISNGKIEYTNILGQKTVIEITEDMVVTSTFNTETVGNKSLIIKYNNYTTTVHYVVGPEFFDTTGIYRFEQFYGDYDLSYNVFFAEPNIIKFGMGSLTDYTDNGLGIGTYTRSLVNNVWVCNYSFVLSKDNLDDLVVTGTITNISKNSITMKMSIDSNTETIIFTKVTQ